MEGIVKWYDSLNSMGFIVDKEGREYFFKKRDVATVNGVFPGLCCMDKVEFSPKEKDKLSDQDTAIKITKTEAYNHGKQ